MLKIQNPHIKYKHKKKLFIITRSHSQPTQYRDLPIHCKYSTKRYVYLHRHCNIYQNRLPFKKTSHIIQIVTILAKISMELSVHHHTHDILMYLHYILINGQYKFSSHREQTWCKTVCFEKRILLFLFFSFSCSKVKCF